VHEPGQPHAFQGLAHPLPPLYRGHVLEQQDVFHVFIGAQHSNKIKRLKDKAEGHAAQAGQLTAPQLRRIPACDEHTACGGPVNAADDIEQGCLAGP